MPKGVRVIPATERLAKDVGGDNVYYEDAQNNTAASMGDNVERDLKQGKSPIEVAAKLRLLRGKGPATDIELPSSLQALRNETR